MFYSHPLTLYGLEIKIYKLFLPFLVRAYKDFIHCEGLRDLVYIYFTFLIACKGVEYLFLNAQLGVSSIILDCLLLITTFWSYSYR